MAENKQLSAHEYFTILEKAFQEKANPENGAAMKAYMRGQFDYFGARAPVRKQLMKEHYQAYGLLSGAALEELVGLCWRAPQRELQQLAVDLIMKVVKKQDAAFMKLVESCILHKSWWDTVDFLSGQITGKLMTKFPELIEQYPDRWIHSDNRWLNRSAILFQLFYKTDTDTDRLFRYILQHAASKEFFIQKASGWALRQYAKTDPDSISSFVQKNEDRLSVLTKREAMKRR